MLESLSSPIEIYSHTMRYPILKYLYIELPKAK